MAAPAACTEWVVTRVIKLAGGGEKYELPLLIEWSTGEEIVDPLYGDGSGRRICDMPAVQEFLRANPGMLRTYPHKFEPRERALMRRAAAEAAARVGAMLTRRPVKRAERVGAPFPPYSRS